MNSIDISTQINKYQSIIWYESIRRPLRYIVWEFERSTLVVPKYQREFRRPEKKQSKFIESLIMWLPIPSVFIAPQEWKLEIVDGSQRIRTIVSFCTQIVDFKIFWFHWPSSKLKLKWLEKLTHLNWLYFEDLPNEYKEDFWSRWLWINKLNKSVATKTKVRIFDRINSQSYDLQPMERRIWTYDWPFIKSLIDLVDSKKLSVSDKKKKKKWVEELYLRFFWYLDYFLGNLHWEVEYQSEPEIFFDEYTALRQWVPISDKEEELLGNVIDFINENFPSWFKKAFPWKPSRWIPNARFEAISVWTALAIIDWWNIIIDDISNRLYSSEFDKIVSSWSSNNKSKLTDRIQFVKHSLIWKPYKVLWNY